MFNKAKNKQIGKISIKYLIWTPASEKLTNDKMNISIMPIMLKEINSLFLFLKKPIITNKFKGIVNKPNVGKV